ncbi:MAG TPA: hypothetical protein VGM76_18675 [Lacipirellulaceae bacterium]|jgi:hypothetical protein
MDWMLDRWDVALMLATTYVAVITLVRLMARRRDQVVADVEQQIQSHRKQTKAKTAKTKKGREAA